MGKVHKFRQPVIANLFPLAQNRKQEIPIDLQMQAAGLPKPEAEFQFALTMGRKWAFDRAWPEILFYVEIEGGTFGQAIHVGHGAWTKRGDTIVQLKPNSVVRVGGRHNAGPGYEKDLEKYNEAAILGWTGIRVTTRMIRDGEAIGVIERGYHMRRRVHEQINKTATYRQQRAD